MIAFLGPAGTFAHAAALRLGGDDAQLLPLATVTLAIDAVRSGQASAAVVPLENSVEGAVPATLDELANGDPLVIVAETYLPVQFAVLVRPGVTAADVTTVATHPHAEAQCRRWLMTNLPGAALTLLGSTAGGAAAVAAGEFDAALAPLVAADLYGLEVLADEVADNAGALTRFVLLTRPGTPPPPTGNDRTSMVAYVRADRAGALLELLTEFAVRGINLTRIESRPVKSRVGHYSFSIDCEGHLLDARVSDVLAALHRVCADLRYLGSYPRTEGQQAPVPDGRTDDDFAAAAAWLDELRG